MVDGVLFVGKPMDTDLKPARLSLLKTSKPKSREEIIEVLTVALEYARNNNVHRITISMDSDRGLFYCSPDLG